MVDEKKMPETHHGHWIGPAPTSEELGITRKKETDDKANRTDGDGSAQQEGD